MPIIGDKRVRCSYCGRFMSWTEWAKNWRLVQAPGVMDPERYAIEWCDACAGADDEEWGTDSAQELLERGPR
jgi:hypothetical protein